MLYTTLFTYLRPQKTDRKTLKCEKDYYEDDMKVSIYSLTILLFSIFSLSSCGLPAYAPPSMSFMSQNATGSINKNYDKVWISLMDYSATTFFVITNFEKDSGLLSLQFSSESPGEFVDCGYIKTLTYSGPIVNMWPLGVGGFTQLNGSMNVFVKPVSRDVTQIRVNARYILQANYMHPQTWIFDTGGSDTKKMSSLLVTCQPTYKAERTILDGVTEILQE